MSDHQAESALSRAIEHYVIARSLAPWNHKEHDDLEPSGRTVAEVVDHWMACRAATFDVGLGQIRYGLTGAEVGHLSEHIQKWLDMSTPSEDTNGES